MSDIRLRAENFGLSSDTNTLDALLGTPRSDMVHIDTTGSATAAIDLSATHS